jgi:hypothetical protein
MGSQPGKNMCFLKQMMCLKPCINSWPSQYCLDQVSGSTVSPTGPWVVPVEDKSIFAVKDCYTPTWYRLLSGIQKTWDKGSAFQKHIISLGGQVCTQNLQENTSLTLARSLSYSTKVNQYWGCFIWGWEVGEATWSCTKGGWCKQSQGGEETG